MSWLAKSSFPKAVVVLALVGAAFAVGRCSMVEEERQADSAAAPQQAPAKTRWTCPMHPEIRLPEFGSCPKCGMDLVPFDPSQDAGPRRLVIPPESVELARIRTAPVERRFVTRPVKMVGKIDFDETRVRTIAARVPGRLERLYVDYTGVRVDKNDHLVRLYSPQLLTAQEELLVARKRLAELAEEATGFLAESTRRGYQAAREKLLLWGLTEQQVDAVEQRGTAEDTMLIRSPAEGVVIHKALDEGAYVQEGTPIYRIADLGHLWIQLDAYEQDLPWLRYGQAVSFNTEALPGEVYEGWIAFIDPVVDDATRTVRVRVHVDNQDGRLKPGMFARAVVQSRVGDGGQVIEPRLRGKWISPMHPEIVKDGPGVCDVCGMDLVPAESLLDQRGIAAADGKPLVVPASAVLVTGTRAVVYVQVPATRKPTFEGREIVLGPRAGDHYIVRSGLDENERVVVHGAFRVDSAMQIQAKPSMMSMRGEEGSFTGPDTAVFRVSLAPVYEAYFAMQDALAHDDAERARSAAGEFRRALDGVKPGALPRAARVRWEDEEELMRTAAIRSARAETIDQVRVHFQEISRGVLAMAETFHHPGQGMHYEAYCPMAFDDKGAAWLQTGEDIRNPYFGSSMYSCGEIRSRIPGVDNDLREATDEGIPRASSDVDDRGEQSGPTKKENEQDEQDGQDEEKEQSSKEAGPEKDDGSPEAAAGTPRAEPRIADPVFAAYLTLQTALAADDVDAARAAVRSLGEAVGALLEREELPDGARRPLEGLVDVLPAEVSGVELDGLRKRFETWTARIVDLHGIVGHGIVGSGDEGAAEPLYRMHCPMAFDGAGADWVQRGRVLANPYFGASMLRCGRVEEELAATAGGGR